MKYLLHAETKCDTWTLRSASITTGNSISKWIKLFVLINSFLAESEETLYIIFCSFAVMVSTTFMVQKQLVLSYYMHPEMLFVLFGIIHFFFFLPGCDEVLNDESQTPHPPTLLFTCFWHCWLGAVTWSIKDDYYVLMSRSQINDWSLATTKQDTSDGFTGSV